MKKILFIDDDEIVLETFKMVFSDLNYHVTTCISGEEGLLEAQKETYDLIITDYLMSGLDGIEVVKRVKSSGIKTKMYILTSHINEPDFIKNANKAGVDGIMEKPFEISKIVTLLGYS